MVENAWDCIDYWKLLKLNIAFQKCLLFSATLGVDNDMCFQLRYTYWCKLATNCLRGYYVFSIEYTYWCKLATTLE